MASYGMLRRVALVRTDVSEELSASFIRVRQLLDTAIIVPSLPILVTLMKEALCSFEKSVLTRATRHNTPEDGILYSHRRENLKSYIQNLVSKIYFCKKAVILLLLTTECTCLCVPNRNLCLWIYTLV
jgi:hypothetical protein